GLYSVPRDGSQAPVLLNGPAQSGTQASSLTLAPGGQGLFKRFTLSPAHHEVYAVPADGSLAPRRISAPMSGMHFVRAYRLSPDGERVACRADQRSDETYERFATTVSGDVVPVPYRLDLGL